TPDDTTVTVFDSVGFAVEDWTALRFVRDDVPAGLLQHLDLVAEPEDPKDLYSLVLEAQEDDRADARRALDRLMGLAGRGHVEALATARS
ncbi:MAG TPA: hypothetical protein VN027_12870, partial [Isoptericola sp.]|nr:hypothetical protein [Isoptericola sp.]